MECRLEHLGFAASDPRRLADWYVRCLGGTQVWDNGATPPALFVRLQGGLVLEIYPAAATLTGVGTNSNAGLRHLAFRVDCIEEARARLETLGVTFTEPVKPAGGGGRVLFFTDPEGNLVHLVDRPSDAPLAQL
jgi:glyoxylase I family protein